MSHKRSRARRLAVQALYQWQLTAMDCDDIISQFSEQHNMKKIDQAFFNEIIYKIPQYAQQLEDVIKQYLSRNYSEIDPIERGILLIATYELVHRLDIPYRVVINEAIELAKTFAAEDAHMFVNSVLDKVAAQQRTAEVTAHSRSKSV